MRKTSFMFTSPYGLLEDIDPNVLLKFFSNLLPLAEKLEKDLEVPDDYGLLWALKWNTYRDSPILPSMFATISLCTTARTPRAFDEFVNPCSWGLGRGPIESKTSHVVICVTESRLLISITEKEIGLFGGVRENIPQIVSEIKKEFLPYLQDLQEKKHKKQGMILCT